MLSRSTGRAGGAVFPANVGLEELHHVYFVRDEDSFAFCVWRARDCEPMRRAYAQSEIKVLSSRADSASGGDAVIQVRVPLGVSVLQVDVLRNGVEVTGAFVATDLTTLRGLVSGLNVGPNVILARSVRLAVFSPRRSYRIGPSLAQFSRAPTSGPGSARRRRRALGHPRDRPLCPARYDWFYRTTAGTFQPLRA